MRNSSTRHCSSPEWYWTKREEGRAQPLKEWHHGWRKRTRTAENQVGPRRRKTWLPVDLRLHYVFTVSQSLNDTPQAMAVLRLTAKGWNVGSSPVPGNLCPSSKITGILLLHISLWNYPVHENQPPSMWGPLTVWDGPYTPSVECVSPKAAPAFWDTPHSVCGMCVSLNKSTSYLSLCLSLNSLCDET